MWCKMADERKSIGAQIEKRRKQLHVSQADLAELSGVSLRTVNAVEKGSANPSVETLSRILEPIGLVLALTERVVHE